MPLQRAGSARLQIQSRAHDCGGSWTNVSFQYLRKCFKLLHHTITASPPFVDRTLRISQSSRPVSEELEAELAIPDVQRAISELNKKLGFWSRVDVHRYPSSTKRYRVLDKGLGIRGKYLQIGQFRVDTNIGAEVGSQPHRPDIAGPLPVFVLAGLAIGSLPAIFDRAIKYLSEEGDLVVENTLHCVQRRHVLEPGAQSKYSRIDFRKPQERAVLAPGHFGEIMIPDQEIRVGADRTD